MRPKKYTMADLNIEELTQETDLSGFCCDAGKGDDPMEVNDYILNYSKDHLEKKLSKTYLFYHGSEIVGAIAMSMGSIYLKDLPPDEVAELGELDFKQVPVLLLGQIGTDVNHRRRGVCREMCEFALGIASKLSEEVGCRYVALATITEKVPIYESCGFIRKTSKKPRVIMAQRIV